MADEAPLYENSTPWWRITIKDRATGAPRSLAGLTAANFKATIGRRGQIGTPGTVTVQNAAGGVVDVVFPQGSAKQPSVLAQLEAQIGGIWDTVWSEETPVRVSLDQA